MNSSIDIDVSPSLATASMLGHTQCVKLLMKKENIDVNCLMLSDNNHRISSLWLASQNGHAKVVRALLKHAAIKVDLHPLEGALQGVTALYQAAAHNRTAVVALLLQHEGINVNQAKTVAMNGKIRFITPLYVACVHDHHAVVQMLCSHKNIALNHGDEGYTALYIACQQNHVECVKILLQDARLLPNRVCHNSLNSFETPLANAMVHQRVAIVEVFLRSGVDLRGNHWYREKDDTTCLVCNVYELGRMFWHGTELKELTDLFQDYGYGGMREKKMV